MDPGRGDLSRDEAIATRGHATVFPGLGATYVIGTDRHAVTICQVSEDRSTVGIRFDKPLGPGLYEPADVRETPERWFKLDDAGVFRLNDRRFGHLELGRRETFIDPNLPPLR